MARSGGGGTGTVAVGPLRSAGAAGRADGGEPASRRWPRRTTWSCCAGPTRRPGPPAMPSPRCRRDAGQSRRQVLIANSEGLLARDEQARTRFSVSCVATGDTGLQTGFESAARTVGFELFDEVSVEELADLAATTCPDQAGGPPGALRRAAGGARRRERRHPLPRGLRARPRGRPHREGRLGLHRQGRTAGGQPAGHAGRRRHRRRRVGDLRRRRRGPTSPAERPDRERAS